jgi:hypothetical protein
MTSPPQIPPETQSKKEFLEVRLRTFKHQYEQIIFIDEEDDDFNDVQCFHILARIASTMYCSDTQDLDKIVLVNVNGKEFVATVQNSLTVILQYRPKDIVIYTKARTTAKENLISKFGVMLLSELEKKVNLNDRSLIQND